MSKIKAKLTALLMTACCCLACIGIGVSFNKANNVVANAATTEELTAEFTNNGQFALATSSKTTGGYTVVDSTTAQSTLPNGYSGAVLEIYHSSSGSYDFVTVDFSNSKIPAKDVVSIVVRVWVDNYNYTDDSTDNDDEFRTIGAVTGTQRQYGIGKLNVEDTWTDVALTAGSITDMTDAYGYLNAIDLGLRDKGGASHVYIDSVTVNCVEWETVNVGKVDLYSNGSNETSLARLNLKPIDQTVAWYNTNDNFIYESGTGLQVIRNDEVVFSENRALANRNSALGKDSNVKYFYLDISKIDIQAGDVVKYGGTFYNTNSGMKYVIEDSEVLWDGAFWGKNTEYTTHNTGALTIRSSISSGKAIYAKTAETMPFKGWGNAFYLESGTGLLINGESATMNSMQSPPEGMYFTFNQVTEVGTELTIGGTFYCPTQKLKYVIPDTKFVWNGSAWENYIEYTKYNLGALKFQQVGGDGNRYVYLLPGTGHNVGDGWGSGWDAEFSYKNGIGVTVNGETVSATVKFPNSMFIDLKKAPAVGDILRVGGTFYNTTVKKQYIVPEAAFQYDGTKWNKYIDYTTYEIGQLALSTVVGEAGSATAMYVMKSSGAALEVPAGDWNKLLTYESGTGVTLNGTQIDMGEIKFPASIYVALKTTAKTGDKVVIGGTFYNEALAVKYVIEDSEFWWNGTGWQMEEYQEPVIEYTDYELGTLLPNNNSNGVNEAATAATALYMKREDGKAMPIVDGTWKALFTLESGDGWKLNGNPVTTGNFVSADAGLYVSLADANVQAGDLLTVSGSFIYEGGQTRYILTESKFIWAGTAWLKYVEPTTYNIGKLAIDGGSTATAINFKKANGEGFEVKDGTWAEKLYYVGGTGVTLNGTQIKMNDIKIPNNLYVALGTTAVAGDELVIGGEFYSSALKVKYVIRDSKFVFDGENWNYVAEYTEVNLGRLITKSNNNTNNERIYMKTEGDNKFVDVTPDYIVMTYVSGTQVLVNGEAREYTRSQAFDSYFYLKISPGAEIGDKVTFGGVFVNEEYKIEYTIEDSDFWWNGTTWQTEPYIVYTTYELGQLSFKDLNGGNAKFPQFNNENNVEIPSDAKWLAYTCEEGVGAQLNGANVAAIKFPGLVFIEFTAAPQEGDMLVIGGTFYNAETALKFVIEETTLWWDGEAWTTEAPAMYTIYTLGTLKFQKVDGENKHIYLKQSSGTAIANSEWAEFILESGAGVMMNDAAANAVVKFPGCVFIELSSAPAQGDKLTIGGIFYNEELMVKYVIPETILYWDEVEWDAVDSSEYEEYNLGEMVVASPSAKASSAKATQLYLKRADGEALPFPDANWNTEFAYQSGIGVLLNGEWLSIIDLESTNSGLYLALSNAGVKVGDVITLGGTYKSADVNSKYIFTESSFMWNGSFWVNYVTNDRLEAYDVITIQDIGFGETLTWEGTVSEVQHDFAPSKGNTTKSVVVRFGFNSENTAAQYPSGKYNDAGEEIMADSTLRFRLRGSNWQGIFFDIKAGKIYLGDANKSYTLESNTDYIVELGCINLKDGRVWTYVTLDGTLVLSEVISTTQFKDFSEFATTGYTNHISIYASGIAATTITDPDGVKVTYVSSAGTHTEKVKKDGVYTLAAGKGLKTFIGWVCDGVLYAPGTEIIMDKAMTFTALEIDFTMQDGAAIRIGTTAEKSGIRFTSQFNKAEFDALIGQYGIESIAYGTLIIPYDYLELNQKPNLEDFDPEKDEILKIESTPIAATGEYLVFRGAMQDLYEGNYGRLFAGRAYMEITFAGGEVWTIYTAFNSEENVRSIRIIAKAFKADTSEPKDEKDLRYSGLNATQQAVVDAYIGSAEINLMNYDAYEANAMPIIAWNFPALDPTNNYVNDGNIAIANTMKAAGIKVIGLTGANILSMSTVTKIEQTRQIIDFFWSQGIGTFAFQNNGGNNFNIDFAQSGYPDFSDCEGFMGFLAWDEPSVASIDTIATQVEAFEAAYAGTDVIFMGNLLPSYASIFGSLDSIDKAAFKAYLQKYCDVVLSKVSGTKWLSIDTYPIMANETLLKTFLFDIGTLKTTALANDAHAHVILQSYGFVENNNDDKERMPTEEELRMQMYTAMAFGVDSFSWYVYSPNGHGESDTAVDVNGAIVDTDNYNALKNINTEWNAIGKVYSAFSWKGIILGAGKDNSFLWSKDNDYKAFEMVMGQLGDYELTASDTKHLASVKTNKTNWNYLMGVMEDKNGNEGYVLCNYNSHEENRAQTITLTFDTNVTEVVIYRGGVAETLTVTNKTLTVNLATGEGVIILPSKIG